FGLLPVAIHHTVTAGNDLTNAFAVMRNVVPIRIDDANLYAGNCVTGAGLLPVTFLISPRQSGFYSSAGKYRRGLGKSVAREAGAPKLLFHLTYQGGRRSCATDAHALKALQVEFWALRAVHERCSHSRHNAQRLSAFTLNQTENFCGFELAHHYMLTTYIS